MAVNSDAKIERDTHTQTNTFMTINADRKTGRNIGMMLTMNIEHAVCSSLKLNTVLSVTCIWPLIFEMYT